MNLREKYIIFKLRYTSTPTFWFKRNLLRKLEVELVYDQETPRGFFILFRTYHKYVVVGFIVLFILGGGGGAVYAYSSPSVTEETPWFAVKNGLETIEEKMQRTPERRAQFFLKKIDRREAEADFLQKRHHSIEGTQRRIKKIEDQLEEMQGQLEYIGNTNSPLRDKIKSRLEHRKKFLEHIQTHRETSFAPSYSM